MTGLITIISSVLGLFSGALPDIIKEWTAGRSHTRELEFLRVQNELQTAQVKANADARIREADGNAAAELSRSIGEHLKVLTEVQARPTGIAWIDAFNALFRPVVSCLIMLLFVYTAFVFVDAVMEQYRAGAISAKEMVETIWSSLVGFSIEAVLGFWFGARGYKTGKKLA